MADINLGVGAANSATGGYDIDNSLKFESDNSERISFTPSSAVASDSANNIGGGDDIYVGLTYLSN